MMTRGVSFLASLANRVGLTTSTQGTPLLLARHHPQLLVIAQEALANNSPMQDLLYGLQQAVIVLAADAAIHCVQLNGQWSVCTLVYETEGIYLPHDQIEDDAGYTSIVTASIAEELARRYCKATDPQKWAVAEGVEKGLRRALHYRKQGLPAVGSGTKGADVTAIWCKAIIKEPSDEGDSSGGSSHGDANSTAKPIVFQKQLVELIPEWSILDKRLEMYAKGQSGSSTSAWVNRKAILLKVASEIVRIGLHAVASDRGFPMAVYGGWSGVDRDEIGGFQTLRRLMRKYLITPNWKAPLALAAFGPPGSGKSFGIREIAKALRQERSTGSNIALEELEFNLGGFTTVGELARVLHISRDATLRGEVPLVIFDEFDATFEGHPHGWLKYLLAPIQDGKFRDGDALYNIGRAIFVFVGGVSHTFADLTGQMRSRAFVEVKGPDFVSRLRGHVNIRGLDPMGDRDEFYILRRAIIMHDKLKKQFRERFNPTTLDQDVVNAFLTVKEYRHGVRSMEAIIQMSDYTEPPGHLTKSSLPPPDQLDMHTDAVDFLNIVMNGAAWRETKPPRQGSHAFRLTS